MPQHPKQKTTSELVLCIEHVIDLSTGQPRSLYWMAKFNPITGRASVYDGVVWNSDGTEVGVATTNEEE